MPVNLNVVISSGQSFGAKHRDQHHRNESPCRNAEQTLILFHVRRTYPRTMAPGQESYLFQGRWTYRVLWHVLHPYSFRETESQRRS